VGDETEEEELTNSVSWAGSTAAFDSFLIKKREKRFNPQRHADPENKAEHSGVFLFLNSTFIKSLFLKIWFGV
jgi:hypothetical protein